MIYIFSVRIEVNDSTYIILATDKATCLQMLVDRLITDPFSFYCNDLNSLEEDMQKLISCIDEAPCVEIKDNQESKVLFKV